MIRTATHRRRRPGWLVVTVITLLSAAASARQDPFEPTVTTEEAELLALVTEVAATNVHAAVALLTGEDLSDAGPALDFALGNLYFRSDDLLAAKRSYELAIGKMPKFRGALANLGRVYLLQEQTADAIRIYQGLVKDGQADADILVLLGHALLLSERELSAENAYRQAILLDPDNRDALLGIAKCLLLQQRYRESVSLLDEVLALDPINSELWSIRANAYLALDDTDNAIVSLECASRLGLASSDMFASLGDLYLNERRYGDAVRAYTHAFAQEELSADRLAGAAEGLLMAGRTDNAKALLEALDKRDDLTPDLTWTVKRLRGVVAAREGRTDDAVGIYEELLAERPLSPDALIELGDLHRDGDEFEKAVMAYERAARVAGCEAKALVRQAQVEVERDRYSRAVELLEAAQAFDPQPRVARYLEQVRRLAQ